MDLLDQFPIVSLDLMAESQRAAYHIGYLKALGDLLEVTKTNPMLTQEHLVRAIDIEVLRMKRAEESGSR
jgi:hypothetical protein